MKSAKDLLLEFTASAFSNPPEAASMFAPDGAFELPYLTDFGFPGRYAGHLAITEFFTFVRGLYPGFVFNNVNVLIDTPEQVFAEYQFTAISSKTGRKVTQLVFGRLVAENGRIKLLREALNSAEIARAVYARGIPELPSQAAEQVA